MDDLVSLLLNDWRAWEKLAITPNLDVECKDVFATAAAPHHLDNPALHGAPLLCLRAALTGALPGNHLACRPLDTAQAALLGE